MLHFICWLVNSEISVIHNGPPFHGWGSNVYMGYIHIWDMCVYNLSLL